MNEDFNDIMSRLSENAKISLQKADFFSKQYNRGYMGTEHLLLGLLEQDTSTAAVILAREGISLHDIEPLLDQPSKEVSSSDMAMMSLSESVVLTLRLASAAASEFNSNIIGTEHLLHALLAQKTSRAAVLLGSVLSDLEKFQSKLNKFLTAKSDHRRFADRHKAKKSLLTKFGRDLTAAADEGKLDTVIGRNDEIERVITILSRRNKSNPVLIGEAGVGKTAIVEGLANRIAAGSVPIELLNKQIFEIDLSSVVAGTKFRGDFEERIKGIISEAAKNPDVILFIDELHLMVGAGSGEGTMDAANILKPALARGEICLIGATTSDEYRRHVESDKALSRRFQTVLVNEPSPENTIKILKGIKAHYEKHHSVAIPDELLPVAIDMSMRYISDRSMPDKVIDIIDEAAALAHVASTKKSIGSSNFNQSDFKAKLRTLRKDLREAIDAENYQSATKIEVEINQIESDYKLAKSALSTEKVVLTEADLARAVSLKTGIPVSKVHGSELTLLSDLESHLKKSIIGQEEAIAKVAKAVRRGRSGIASVKRPIGSFLFMGPTGVGKTELARVIAREVFGGEDALIKIDMSEFGEKHNVSRLLGAPAGYVGYEDGGNFTEAVRRRPYSVVLFDEIEKAHPAVFNILLQILEDGVITDGHGNKIKFNNTIVILTSNLGAAAMHRESELGFAAKTIRDHKALAAEYEENKASALKALSKQMRPELINRFDAILVFHALTRKHVEKIFDNMISDLKKRLVAKKISLILTDKAKNFLIEQGYSPKDGARPLRRTIEDQLESLLSEAIILDQISAGQIAYVDASRGQLKLAVKTESDLAELTSSATQLSAPKISKAAKSSKSSKSIKSSPKSKSNSHSTRKES